MDKRTVIEFEAPASLWETTEEWAQSSGFKLREDLGTKRIYQKGTGFLVAPMMLEIDTTSGPAKLEAYIRAGTLVRAMSLFILPSEMGVQSGGIKGVAPRKIARGKINQLLERLGQPAIP